jgi:alkanesulfonate monooxygenase SsuD/methylene tetrahydromethanopterin reductase-like flavin-dependent oxidoreductase (luciferase family)
VAARWADVWHTWAAPEELSRRSAVLEEHCLDIGRDPHSIERATGGSVRIGASEDGGDRDVEGSPAQVLERLAAYRDAGAGEFVVRDHAADPLDDALDQLDRLTTQVLPALGD